MKWVFPSILFYVVAVSISCKPGEQSGIPAPADTTLALALIDSSYEYSFSDPNHAIAFADSALEFSKRFDFMKGMAGAHGELGYAYSVKGDFQKSREHLDKGITFSKVIGDTIGLVSQLNDLGSVYKTQSQYDRALEYYFKALDICRHIDLKRGISATLGNIGLSYFEMDEHEKALEYYNKAMEINKRLDNRSSLAVNYNNMGLLYGDEGRFDDALDYHFKALKLRRELGYTLEVANSLNNIGRLYMQQGKHEEALNFLNEALEVNDDRDRELTSIIHENFAKNYISSGSYDSALVHAERTLNLSEDFGSRLGMKVGYELLAEIYRDLGDYRKAYEYQQLLAAVKDSILNEEKAQQISELEAKYQTARKEKEIAILEQENKRQALLRNAFLAGLVLIGIIGGLVYNRQRLKIRKNRAELENQRLRKEQLEQDLEFKNKQLTTHTLHLVQKNETMKELKEKISAMNHQEDGNMSRALQKLRNLINYSFSLDNEWEQFRLFFEEVHTGFFEELKAQYPELTPNELRLAALVKLNLSIKETATILGITPDSVKTARYRLRKKLDIETGDNLSEFLMDVEKERTA